MPAAPSTTSRPSPAAATLDATDRVLVDALVADARLSVNELARRADVSRATAYTRLERLQRDGVIRAFRAEVDPAAIGVGLAAMILVNVEQGSWMAVRDELVHLPGFEYLAVTSGGFDFVVLVRVADVSGLREVVLQRLHQIPAVRQTQTIFVLDETRRPVGLGATPATALEATVPGVPPRTTAREGRGD